MQSGSVGQLGLTHLLIVAAPTYESHCPPINSLPEQATGVRTKFALTQTFPDADPKLLHAHTPPLHTSCEHPQSVAVGQLEFTHFVIFGFGPNDSHKPPAAS
jgi:hypothetical protein